MSGNQDNDNDDDNNTSTSTGSDDKTSNSNGSSNDNDNNNNHTSNSRNNNNDNNNSRSLVNVWKNGRSPWETFKIHQRGVAVEAMCSDVRDVVYCLTTQYYPHQLHPPPTAPPCNEHPVWKNGRGPWEMRLLKGHFEVSIRNGSEIRDPQIDILRALVRSTP